LFQPRHFDELLEEFDDDFVMILAATFCWRLVVPLAVVFGNCVVDESSQQHFSQN
jgi:hypothetical protein